ncbi:MAG: putative bifunctional diguanylate cyclase/phosphodiesterase, partial [Parahaliea sp.]
DQFKIVNDTCGHAAGDELLQMVADLLTGIVGEANLVTRLGGDEFAVLLRNCDIRSARILAERMREHIARLEFHWEERLFRIGASVGGIMIDHETADVSWLMKQADAACYTAKDGGRNRVHIFEGEDLATQRRQGEIRWAQRLQEALENDEFVLFSQPILPLKKACGHARYEVLLRLQHRSNNSLITPDVFLPAAERYGLSKKIDRWVVSNLVSRLKAGVLEANHSHYWVNLSGISLSDASFMDFLEQTIARASLPRGCVNFEITETAVISNLEAMTRYMQRMNDLGCAFALDDFGTGVSSFGYLKNLPVEFLKIDGMFVRDILDDPVDQIFVKSVIDIAQVMGIQTIAEFVESHAIAQRLAELGADYGQGYALGRPTWLTANTERPRKTLSTRLS